MNKIFLEDFKLNQKRIYLANSVIHLKGEDAQTFLNSQTTNDVLKLKKNQFHFSSMLDLAGRIESLFILLKKSETQFDLIVNEEDVERTFERLERFHISEEFDVSIEKIHSYLITHDKNQKYPMGTYYFENDQIEFSKDSNLASDSSEIYDVLFGIQKIDFKEKLELINNTRYDELAVDYKKGCFPGQETVSKVNTRRGAAFKPVLLECDSSQNVIFSESSILFNDKKVGKMIKSIFLEKKIFIMASLGREYRVDKSKKYFSIGEYSNHFKIHLYPYLSTTSAGIARECYDYAIELFHKNENDKAISYFEKAIELDPLFDDAYESLGVLYGRLENYSKAIELMEKLKMVNPKCMMAYTNLSLFHMKIGEIEKAENYKSEATLLNFQLLGDEAEKKKKEKELQKRKLAERDKREKMFLQVLDIDDADAMANNGLAEISLEKKDYNKAKNYFSKAIESDPKYSVAYLGLGKSYIALNTVDDAVEVLKRGIEVATKNGDMMPANEMQRLLNHLFF